MHGENLQRMRCGGNVHAVFIGQLSDGEGEYLALRRKAFHGFSGLEMVALLHLCGVGSFVPSENQSDKVIGLLRLGFFVFLRRSVRILEGKGRGIRTVGHLFQLFPPFGADPVVLPFLIVGINGSAVCRRDSRRIVDTLHAPFDFQGGSTGFNELLHMIDHAQVLAVEDVGAVRILFHRPVLSRSGFLHDRIMKAARLDAFTPVRLTPSSGKEIGQEAAAGPGNAHRAVAEYFQLDINLPADIGHFLHGNLSCQNDTGGAQLLPHGIAFASLVGICAEPTSTAYGGGYRLEVGAGDLERAAALGAF